MTEVLRSSFTRHLPRVLAAIQRAEFVAVDLEFTGIAKAAPKSGVLIADAEYQRAFRTARQFAVAQVGISCFRVPAAEASNGGAAGSSTPRAAPQDFEAETFNFYVAPPRSSTFTCTTEALTFLSSHSFDFNKFIGAGVEFESLSQRQRLVGHFSRTVAPEVAVQMANERAGFAAVVDALWRRRVPLVGHNMLLDMALLLQQFHEPLPRTCDTFSALLLKLFSSVWDTKHVAHALRHNARSDGFEHPTSLGTLFSQCSFDTQRALSPLCTRYQHAASDRGSDGTGAPTGVDSAGEGGGVGGSAAGFPHEAGYDAYMTGCVLLDLAAKHGGAGGDVLAFLRTPPPSLVNHIAIRNGRAAVPLAKSRRRRGAATGQRAQPGGDDSKQQYLRPARHHRVSPLSASSSAAPTAPRASPSRPTAAGAAVAAVAAASGAVSSSANPVLAGVHEW